MSAIIVEGELPARIALKYLVTDPSNIEIFSD